MLKSSRVSASFVIKILWLFPILWAVPITVFLYLILPTESFNAFIVTSSIFLGLCHTFGPIHLVYTSKVFPNELKTKKNLLYIPFIIIGIVLLISLGMVFVTQLPNFNSPKLKDSWFYIYFILFWMGHFWHFGKQNFGILTIFRTKAGQFDVIDKKLDKIYCALMLYLIQPYIYITVLKTHDLTRVISQILPTNLIFGEGVSLFFVFLTIFLTIGMCARELKKDNSSSYKVAYYLTCSLPPVFLFFFSQTEYVFLFTIIYLWTHWIISIGLTYRISFYFHKNLRSFVLEFSKFLVSLLAIIYIILQVKHYSLFSSGTNISNIMSHSYSNILIFYAIFHTYFMCEQLFHFYTERLLFKFKDPIVKKEIWPLIK